MALWAYVCLPETTGYALEDIKYLFEGNVIQRALQDAPGGRVFLPKSTTLAPEVVPHVPELNDTRQSDSSSHHSK
jgi:hypothetical protein